MKIGLMIMSSEHFLLHSTIANMTRGTITSDIDTTACDAPDLKCEAKVSQVDDNKLIEQEKDRVEEEW